MKANRILNLGLVSLFVLATLLSASVTSVQAGHGLPGYWTGTPDPDDCNNIHDCIYIFTICYRGHTQTLGSHDPSQLQHQALVDIIGAEFGACAEAPPKPVISGTGRCKLTGIDAKIYIGGTFSASWLGKINNLRFRNSDGVIVFVTAIPGSAHFADGKAHALFSLANPSTGATLLAPGNYQVSCFGLEGSVGGEIKVTVAR